MKAEPTKGSPTALIAKLTPLGIVGAVVGSDILWGVIFVATGNACAAHMGGEHGAMFKQLARLIGILWAIMGVRNLVTGKGF